MSAFHSNDHYWNRGTEVEVRLRNLRFTHDSVSETFATGDSLEASVKDLVSGKTKITDYPAMQVFERSGLMFSVNNRRLLVFLHYGVRIKKPSIKVKVLLMRQKKHWKCKLTSRSFGETIFVRGEKQHLDEIWQTAQDEGDARDLRSKRKKIDKADREQNKLLEVKLKKQEENLKRKDAYKKLVRKTSV